MSHRRSTPGIRMIEVVDQEDRLRAVLPELEAMVGDRLVTLEQVEVIAYRARAGDPEEAP